MFNLLKKDTVKENVLKNRDVLLDVMAENIKGARQCPFLMGKKCLGQFCELFMQFKVIDTDNGSEKTFYRCSFMQMPLLIIEMNQNLRKLLNNIEVKDEKVTPTT